MISGDFVLYVRDGCNVALAGKDPCAEEQYAAEEQDRVDQADRLKIRHGHLVASRVVAGIYLLNKRSCNYAAAIMRHPAPQQVTDILYSFGSVSSTLVPNAPPWGIAFGL